MARLARGSKAQVQEIPDSYESQQHELSLSSSDVEVEGDEAELIQNQLSQEQPGNLDDEDDDDDGAVNLFLPDIVDIVNKAASTPQKTHSRAQRLAALPESTPVAAARNSSPRSQIELAATQYTQSSTQSEELSHLKNYLRKKAEAEAQAKQAQQAKEPSPLRRPSSRSKSLSRSATPVEQPSQGKADPYEVPSSPEIERRAAPAPQPAVEKETNKPQKRKRKVPAAVQRSAAPEEPVVTKRHRRGHDKPEYSSLSLRKVARSTRAHTAGQEEQEQATINRGRGRSKKPLEAEVDEELEQEIEEEAEKEAEQEVRMVPVIELKRTRSRQQEIDSELQVSSAHNTRSLRGRSIEASGTISGGSSIRKADRICAKCYLKDSNHWHSHLRHEPANGKHYCNNCYSKDLRKKKAQLSVKRSQPSLNPQTSLESVQSPVSPWTKSSEVQAVTQIPGTQSQPDLEACAVPKSALAVYREQQQQPPASQKDEPQHKAAVDAPSPIPETPKQKTRAKSSSVAPQSASPRVLRRPREHFKQPEGEKLTEAPQPGSQPTLLTETELGLETVQEEGEEDVLPAKPQRLRPKTPKKRAPNKKLKKAEEHARRQQEQEEILAAEAEELQKKKAKAEMMKLALAEEKAPEKTKDFLQAARATRSRKPNGDSRLDRVEDSEEPQEQDDQEQPEELEEPETATFSMGEVPDSLFSGGEDEDILVEGDREMADVDEGQAQPVMDDDNAEDEYVQEEQDQDQEEEEDSGDEDEVEDEQTAETSGINSILMNPSPKKVPSQKVAVPSRQSRTEAEKVTYAVLSKAGTSREAIRNASPPSAQPFDDTESVSARSQREYSPTEDPAEDSATTMDFGRNPFKEPIFNFTERSFSGTSRSFLKDMPLERDVRDLFQLTEDLQNTTEGVDRKTLQARDIAKVRRYLVADYKAMIEERDAKESDEGVLRDLYSNVFMNTRKLKKKVNDLIDKDLSEYLEELSNGEQAARNQNRKKLLRDVYLFIVPDMLKVVTAVIKTYCADRPPGMYCFEELHGLVRLTLELLHIGEDETNAPYRPKTMSGGIDYQYPKHKDLMKKLRGIDISCQTILDEQAEYEKAMARERQRREEVKRKELEKKRANEAFLRQQEVRKRQQEEEDAEAARIKKEKLRAWQERNAHILNRYKDRPVPRQVTQMGFPSRQPMSRRVSVQTAQSDPFEGDIRDVLPILPNGGNAVNSRAQQPQQRPRVDNRSVEPRHKPIVKASVRGSPSAPSTVRGHTLPMSRDDDSDDDAAFGSPQEPRRKFIHHPITPSDLPSEQAVPAEIEDEDAFLAMDLGEEEEDLPVHPVVRAVPRARGDQEELSLTQRRLNEEQRIKMLNSELEDLKKAERQKLKALAEVERRKRELEIAEQEYYEGRDGRNEEDVDLDADLDAALQERDDGEEQYFEDKCYDYGEEEDQSVEVGTSFPGNNNRMQPVKPWSKEELVKLTKELKGYWDEKKYMLAAEKLDRDLDEVVKTALEHKEVWAGEYMKKTGKVPEWVRCIGENVACETFGEAVAGPSRRG